MLWQHFPSLAAAGDGNSTCYKVLIHGCVFRFNNNQLEDTCSTSQTFRSESTGLLQKFLRTILIFNQSCMYSVIIYKLLIASWWLDRKGRHQGFFPSGAGY